ncbi:hypothetical protein BpHYR1_012949 [Brachionus plicatilis]|uniref:Uncharacterized protein n=1 Tax=Brachionus plicatilis TaxID=10195 RepID=A0A3M7RCI3_BRAPC|nr:hypothetical protein BpHYR1_012949 [Brachionus plicatilis]
MNTRAASRTNVAKCLLAKFSSDLMCLRLRIFFCRMTPMDGTMSTIFSLFFGLEQTSIFAICFVEVFHDTSVLNYFVANGVDQDRVEAIY